MILSFALLGAAMVFWILTIKKQLMILGRDRNHDVLKLLFTVFNFLLAFITLVVFALFILNKSLSSDNFEEAVSVIKIYLSIVSGCLFLLSLIAYGAYADWKFKPLIILKQYLDKKIKK